MQCSIHVECHFRNIFERTAELLGKPSGRGGCTGELVGRPAGRVGCTGELPINLNVIMQFSIHVEDRFANNVEGHLPFISKAIQHTL